MEIFCVHLFPLKLNTLEILSDQNLLTSQITFRVMIKKGNR